MRRRTDRLVPLLVLPFMLQATLASAASCEATLKEIQQYYNNTVDQCVGADGEPRPASECSGLILRGTSRPEDSGGKAGDWYPWNDSRAVTERGATAATYLRQDINSTKIEVFKDGWTNHDKGYLVIPVNKVGANEPKPDVLCAGPVDLWADERDNAGCGDNQKTPEVEKSCKDMGVDGKTWVNKYFVPHMVSETELIGGKSCAFSLQRNLSNSERAAAFYEFLVARRGMQNVPNQDTSLDSYTEVRIPAEQENKRAIWAFTYSLESGREGALLNQKEYKEITGKDVPVIKVTYPTDKHGVTTFSCDASEAPPPTPATPDGLDAVEKVEGGWGTGDDPKKCSSYVRSAVWINRKRFNSEEYEDSLSVTLTDCGREIGQDQTEAAWTEAMAKAKAAPGGFKFGNHDQTLRRQFVCHLALVEKDANGNDLPVRYKKEFNLETRRPYVSHEQSIRDDCNPEVADPVSGGGGNPPGQCPDYIKSVEWVVRRDFGEYGNRPIQSLKVEYNDCALGFAGDKTPAVMAEMKRKALAADPRGAEYWGDKDVSMRRQAICLVQKYPGKNPVFLESIRPNETSQEEVNRQDCNHK